MLSYKQIKVLKDMRILCSERLIRYGERCDNFFIDYKTKGGYYVRAQYNINGNLKSKVYCKYYDYIQGIPGCIIFKRDLKINQNEQRQRSSSEGASAGIEKRKYGYKHAAKKEPAG